MKKSIFRVISFIAIVFFAIIIFNAVRFNPRPSEISAVEKLTVEKKSIENFSKAIQFETVSHDEEEIFDTSQIAGFIRFLNESYPLMNSLFEKEMVNKYGLLYKWNGKNPSLPPIILMAHMDVVPVEEESRKQWTEAPFSGKEKDGFIYGRGTLDDKSGVIGICEAVEKLLSEHFIPEKTIYIAFGFDEEIGGHNGAAKIAEHLKLKNIKAEFVLDEGMSVTDGIIPGLEKPVALIGIAEKGYLSLELSVNFPGGHSSMPERENAITIVSNAILKLQHNPFPARISEPTELFLKTIGAEMSFAKKLVFANMWLFKKMVMNQFEKTASGNATLRTTISPTIFKSGIKENLIPSEAKAVINFRILSGETSNDVSTYVSKTINDERIKIKSTGIVNEPSLISSVESGGYKAIEKTIREIFPDAIVSPSLVLGATDSKHFVNVAENIYRFLPVRLKAEDLKRIHGINERIETENFKDCVRFYYQLVQNISNRNE